jgi:hypothetical protein
MPGSPTWRLPLLAATLALALASPGVRAQEVPVPADLQAKLFLRILGFDRNLSREGELRVGILVQRRHRASLEAGEELARAFGRLPAGEKAVEVVLLDAETASVKELLTDRRLDAVCVMPLRAVAIEDVAVAARDRKVRTLTGVPGYLSRGLGAGVGLRDQRPEVLINLAAARAEGADYSSQLLAFARLVP